MHNISKLIIHCSATRPSQDIGAAEIRDWHMNDPKFKFADIGYHFVIRQNGLIEIGRPFKRTGAHVRGHNKGSVGICLIGGHGSSAGDDFYEHYSAKQEASLKSLLTCLSAIYPDVTIHGHNEFAAKACPGFDHKTWLKKNGFKYEG